jgi:hypothetical protein
MTTSTLMLPVSDEQDLTSWAAVAFVASHASAARTWSCTPAVSKPEVSLRPRSH